MSRYVQYTKLFEHSLTCVSQIWYWLLRSNIQAVHLWAVRPHTLHTRLSFFFMGLKLNCLSTLYLLQVWVRAFCPQWNSSWSFCIVQKRTSVPMDTTTVTSLRTAMICLKATTAPADRATYSAVYLTTFILKQYHWLFHGWLVCLYFLISLSFSVCQASVSQCALKAVLMGPVCPQESVSVTLGLLERTAPHSAAVINTVTVKASLSWTPV